MPQTHAQALDHYHNGRFAEAIRALEALIIEAPSSELWNDWATAQLAAGESAKAAQGYAHALALDAKNHGAAINQGVLLCSLGRSVEGKPLLENVLPELADPERAQLAAFLATIPYHPPHELESAAPSVSSVAAVDSTTPAPLNVLVVHEFLPHPDRHGADVQWMQMLQELRAQGHRVTHIARSDVNRDRYAQGVEQLGIRVLTPDSERMRYAGVDLPCSWRLGDLLHNERFDLAILTLWFWNAISIPEHYLDDIRTRSPGTFIAVLTDEQHGLRARQMAELTKRWNDFERMEDHAAREMEVYKHCDCVLTISDDDARAFRAKAPELRTARMPMIAEIAAEGPTYEERSGLIFLANFDNLANSDAATWFLHDIWPLVRKEMPDIELALVGNNLPNDPKFHGPGIRRVGYVKDLTPEFGKYRVALSPVRFGTGIKTKNLLALAHAVPLVTTTVGADGMNLTDGETALIADTPEDFALAVVRAYTDDTTWLRLSTNGRQHIAAEFSARRMQRAVGDLCEMARTLKPKKRDGGFQWSFRRVETRSPECLTEIPAQQRPTIRAGAYVTLAAELLAAGDHAEALAQVRHFYGLLHGPVKATGITIRSMEIAAQCYKAMGDAEKAREYERKIAQSCALDGDAQGGSRKETAKSKRSGTLNEIEFSVIVPTYNREQTLALCLDALGRQTFPAAQFEVIVVDDGSQDGTSRLCRERGGSFALHYLRQTNAGAGATRRRGVQHSRGKLLLFINDDTIAEPNLLAMHFEAHQAHAGERQAVLGDFRFPDAARERALTRFLTESPFLFPQVRLERGVHWDYSKFVTCNTSIRRDAVVGVGSFDPEFRLAEDSELGLRLSRRGYYVRYEPKARATHWHLPFTVPDLVRRAEGYGRIQLLLLRKHPGLLGDGSTQYGWLDQKFADDCGARVQARHDEIYAAKAAIEKYDDVNFAEFEKHSAEDKLLSEEVMRMFRRVVPEVYWHFFYASLLSAWEAEARTAAAGSPHKVAAQRDVYL